MGSLTTIPDMRLFILTLMFLSAFAPAQKPAPKPTAKPAAPVFFVNPHPIDQLRNKQAVIETDTGVIVMDLLADRAPNHVALFIKTATEGVYDSTAFHRVIKHGIIQGGDPLSKDPAAKERYGT